MSPITANTLYEAFGLTPPGDQGGQAQEPAAPAAEATPVETDQGEQAQEPAAPAEVETEPAQQPTQEPQEPAVKPEKEVQTEQQRRENAARRRQQEQQAAIDQALSDERQRSADVLKDVLARAGIKNTFTGEPITTLDEFNDWHGKYADAKLQSDLKAGRVTAEGISQLIERHPVVQQAKNLIASTEQRQQEQSQAAETARVEEEISQIGKLNPKIQGLSDILSMETGEAFKQYVRKGYSFLDAYKLANMDAITEQKAAAVKQEALINARGKQHLQATGNTRGAGSAAVPPSQMAMFRRMNPGASDSEITKFYNNYLTRQGG